jgi:hypothetical protein
MPQYRIPQATQAAAFNAQANAYFTRGSSSAATADKYVRLTVLLAAVLFLVGIGSRFPVLAARYGLIAVAGAILVLSVVQLLAYVEVRQEFANGRERASRGPRSDAGRYPGRSRLTVSRYKLASFDT